MSEQTMKDTTTGPAPRCAGRCELAPEPGDTYCSGCREAVPDRRADREDEARQRDI